MNVAFNCSKVTTDDFQFFRITKFGIPVFVCLFVFFVTVFFAKSEIVLD